LKLAFKDEVYQVVGVAMEVHSNLGCGFLEPVYQEALGVEFSIRNIPFQPQTPINIAYKGAILEKKYIADFIAFEELIVEIKAVEALDANHLSQVINYLKGTGFPVGVLINFGGKSLEWKRVILSENLKKGKLG
jgi:GxxExxY protein